MFTLFTMPALSVKIIRPLLLNDQWTNLTRMFEFVLNLDLILQE